MDEQIYVLNDLSAKELVSGEGFVAAPWGTLEEILRVAYTIPRHQAEGNPAVRQIIPYVVLVREGKVFAVTRTKQQSEARLHLQVSIGIGGHLNERDILLGARRELQEELFLAEEELFGLKFLGFINDLSTDVSRDHLGCLFLLEVSRDVLVREQDKMVGEFVPLVELRQKRSQLENWSAIALEVLGNIDALYWSP